VKSPSLRDAALVPGRAWRLWPTVRMHTLGTANHNHMQQTLIEGGESHSSAEHTLVILESTPW
jgi:hypothetical protein